MIRVEWKLERVENNCFMQDLYYFQTPEGESRELAQVLPPELYEKVCQTLNIPIVSATTAEDAPENLAG